MLLLPVFWIVDTCDEFIGWFAVVLGYLAKHNTWASLVSDTVIALTFWIDGVCHKFIVKFSVLVLGYLT